MCGENFTPLPCDMMSAGSPPRVRGKQTPIASATSFWGITPACAGKTTVATAATRGYRDHPRVCGENYQWQRFSPSRAGSPPRVRGKLALCASGARGGGITPACAGKTRTAGRHGRQTGDHPRVCGENALSIFGCSPDEGSPPRVRGKQARRKIGLKFLGITPACAGKTSGT